MNIVNKLKSVSLWAFVALTALVYATVRGNLMEVAPPYMYQDFLVDSEALVLGKIVVDQHGLAVPNRGNLAFVAIQDFKYEPKYWNQAKGLLERGDIADFALTLDDINDDHWVHGVAREFSGVVSKLDPRLDAYIGRQLVLPDGTRRAIVLIDHAGPYSNLYLEGPPIHLHDAAVPVELRISGQPGADSSQLSIWGSVSLYGLQGIVFSKIYAHTHSVDLLHGIVCALFALTVVALAFLYRSIFSNGFAALFILTIVLSPWMVSFARNLFWVPFLWFLPAVFAAWHFLGRTKWQRLLALLFLYLAFAIKCMTGYEYLSTVILLAAAVHVHAFFDPQSGRTKWESVQAGFTVCLLGVAGFLTALLMQASIRGDTIWQGLQTIYEMDVKRMTYGDPNNFSAAYRAALAATPWEVITTYVGHWRADFLKDVPGEFFGHAMAASVLVMALRLVVSNAAWKRDAGLFIAFLMPPLSWMVLAKSHSAMHTHVNFALWYFGFAACILYIPLAGFKDALVWLRARLR